MIRHTGIVEDLRLDECGLTLPRHGPVGLRAVRAGPTTSRRSPSRVDLDRTCASIAAMCGDRDAEAYRAFVTDWGARNEAVFAAFQDVPTAGRLGRHLWGAGKATDVGGLEMSRQFLQPADQLLDEHFADERLKTALAWLGAQSGPADARGRHRRPGRLERADAPHAAGPRRRRLRRADRRAGRAAAPARRHGRGSATARRDHPRPATGSPASRTDVRRAHRRPARSSPAATCSRPSSCSATRRCCARATTAVRVGNGIGMVVRLGTNDLPRYPSAAARRRRTPPCSCSRRAAPTCAPAHGEFVAGRTPTEPAVLLMTFSRDRPDDRAARASTTSRAWAQWHPYELSTGEQLGRHRATARRTRSWRRSRRPRPASPSTIEHVHVQTPLDLERELGLRRGNVMHVEMGLDSMFAYRPLPELAGYRTPVRGLFLTGASTHPGGGVFGASGRTAARVVDAASGGGGDEHRSAYGVRSRRRQPLGCGRRPALAARRAPRSALQIAYPLVDGAWLHRVTIATSWCSSPRPACCTRWCTAASAGRSGCVVVTAGGGLRGGGGRGAHRAAVRRLLLRRHARPRGARRARWSCRWPGR